MLTSLIPSLCFRKKSNTAPLTRASSSSSEDSGRLPTLPQKIAIVGGGASGICVAEAISARTNQSSSPRKHHNLDITIFESSKAVGPGLAYRNDLDVALLNMPVDTMALPNKEAPTFRNWLIKKVPKKVSSQDFVPRAMFGKYLDKTFKNSVKNFNLAGNKLSVIHDTASNIDKAGTSYYVSTFSGHSNKYDAVVLCPGTGRPTDPYHLSGTPRYVDDPYPLKSALKKVGSKETVLIIGSSLSAIDVFRGLRVLGNQGNVVLASRQGKLPTVRQTRNNINLDQFNKDNIEKLLQPNGKLKINDLIELGRAELKSHGVNEAEMLKLLNDEAPAKTQLAQRIDEIKTNSSIFPLLNRMVNENSAYIWHHLTDDDKANIIHNYTRLLNIIRAPMPMQTATVLNEEFRNGKLHVVNGLLKISYDESSKKYLADTPNGQIAVDHVINATRSEKGSLNPNGQRIVDALIANRVGKQHHFGGISTDFDTFQVLSPSNEKQPNLFALGQVTQGDRFITANDFDWISEGSDVIAKNLLEQLSDRERNRRESHQ